MKNKTTNVIASFCLYCLFVNRTPHRKSIIATQLLMDSLIQQLNARFSEKNLVKKTKMQRVGFI